ncbi:HAD-IIB family hydrolase [Thalassoglobus sp. JC818]|uniref:HAD-IIB family hydrolase n=1 Tax=Thalassoglobus sp. JC818 TaxID=3232136 RepID=UPI00345A768E
MNLKKRTQQKIVLISLHGLIRANDLELGRDADTGGQVKYVLELAAELAKHPDVGEVELLTRQIFDPRVSDDYSQVEEPITENARIVRIPFGPKRYLRKELLWPHIEDFIDQTLAHFKRTGLPDVIHGHYADAGFAGAQLARLLHVPFVFTGHSLGRVKRERLMAANKKPEDIEKRYKISRRIEAEEYALETAAMVVTSTTQEVESQYAMYEHYVPDRMEVIPPGVNLTSFRPPADDDSRPAIAAELNRFLQEPDKPLILAMARPDERKNLHTLVETYGQSEELRRIANLVLVLGTREDLRDLAPAQRKVVQQILTLIDVYDLYGKIAYPKTHSPDDVPDLFRLAAQSRGVFINPALTEPFGLTLLEAAASGLPIVATNDGGPRDIVANCRNGLLVDPLDIEVTEQALLRVLTNEKEWSQWSEQGVSGAHEHYSWKHHGERYLRDLNEILSQTAKPALAKKTPRRRIPEFDRLIITDLDNTLTGDQEGLDEFVRLIEEQDHIGFGIATGRTLQSACELIEELGLPFPDLIESGVGTELHYGSQLTSDSSWDREIGYNWNRRKIQEILADQSGLFLQPEVNQSRFKLSYNYDADKAPSLADLRKIIREAKLRANLILSHQMYLDVIPVRGGSGNTMRHVAYKWSFQPEHILVAGDSGNDEGMLKGRTLGVVVGNHSPELESLRGLPRIYFAEAHHARGILEGINYYQFLDHIVIPNDRTE